MSDDKDPMFVTALARGFEILRCFTAERQELGTTEIAKLTKLPQSTVWRLCYTMSQLGYLVPGRSVDRLRVGAGVLMLGHAAVTHAGIGEFAQPLMKQLADRYHASVSLGERDRHEMVIVQRSEAVGILRVNLHVGSALPIAHSSLGWAYLVATDEATRGELLSQLQRDFEGDWDKAAANIAEALKDFRKGGFVLNLGKSHREINAVGVPVVSPDGKRVLALTCGGARSRLTRELIVNRVAPDLQSIAKQIAPLIPPDGRVIGAVR